MTLGTPQAPLIRILALAASMAGLAATTTAHAQENGTERVTASTGYTANAKLITDPVLKRQRAESNTLPDKYLADGVPASKARTLVQQSSAYSGFWIYEARTDLVFDSDGDGFFSGIDVTFDADTDFVAADVYARLYLSLEGGPWILYYTTDVFTIVGTSGTDDYTVETDLVDGYPTGFYDVLIELYDRDYDELVAVYGPVESLALFELPLEDEAADVGIITPPAPPVSVSSGGGGGAGIASVFVAGLVLGLRRLSQRARRRRRRRRRLPTEFRGLFKKLGTAVRR